MSVHELIKLAEFTSLNGDSFVLLNYNVTEFTRQKFHYLMLLTPSQAINFSASSIASASNSRLISADVSYPNFFTAFCSDQTLILITCLLHCTVERYIT